MTRDNIISFCLVVLLLFIFYCTVRIFQPFIHPLFWSAVIAYGSFPLYTYLLKKMKNRRNLAAGLATLMVFLIVAPVVIITLISLTRELLSLSAWLLKLGREGGVEAFIDRLQSLPFVQKILNSQFFQREFIQENMKKWLIQWAELAGRFTIHEVMMAAKNIVVAGANFLLTILLVFFFLRDGEKIYQFVYRSAPLHEDVKELVFKQIQDTFSAVLRGQLFTAIAQSICGGISYWLLGLPLPLLFTGLTFLLALVPVAGAAAVWVPLVIYLLFTQAYLKALILFILGVFVISLIDNLLKPLLIGEKVKLPYFVLLLGIIGGMQAYGLMGIFLAPAILSLFVALVKIYQKKILAQ